MTTLNRAEVLLYLDACIAREQARASDTEDGLDSLCALVRRGVLRDVRDHIAAMPPASTIAAELHEALRQPVCEACDGAGWQWALPGGPGWHAPDADKGMSNRADLDESNRYMTRDCPECIAKETDE